MSEKHPVGYRPRQNPKLDFRPEPAGRPRTSPPRNGCRRAFRLLVFAAFAAVPLVVMTGYRVGLFDSLKEFGDQRAEENLERLMEEAEKRSESPEPSDYAGTWIPRHLERGDQVTALWVAVQNDPEWVRRLVDDEDIDPNLRLTLEGSDSWSTPLGESAKHGFAESVDVLLEAGAELDAADSNGWTALHTAAFFGHPTVVDRLLAAGADPVTKTGGGLTAIELAREKGNDTAVGLLEEHQREH